jgi:hypothetical protein
MRIQQVRTAAEVSNVTARQQGNLFLHKVGRLHDPQATTWRDTLANGNPLSPSEERHILPE